MVAQKSAPGRLSSTTMQYVTPCIYTVKVARPYSNNIRQRGRLRRIRRAVREQMKL